MLLRNEPPSVKDTLHIHVNTRLSALLRRLTGKPQRQLIVCGFPRSGTSLLYNMLSATLVGFRFEPFENYFIYRIHRMGNIASKAPMDVMHLEHVDRLNTNQKELIILIMIRDVRDVVTSRHPVIPDKYFIGHDRSWWPSGGGFDEWAPSAPGVVEIANAIRSVRNRPDAYVIRYEELVRNPDYIQSRIEDLFGLSFYGGFKDYHVRPDKHAYRYEGKYAAREQNLVLEGKKLSRERSGRWCRDKASLGRVKSQFEECPELFSILEEYGYEESRAWFDDI